MQNKKVKLKKIPSVIKRLCKKFGIRLTLKKGGKRKSLCVLLKQLKSKMKKNNKIKLRKSKKTRFGNIITKVGGGIKSKAIATGGAIKRHPVKSLIIGGVLVGGAVATVATFGAAAPAVAAADTALLASTATAGEAALTAGKAAKALKAAQAAKKAGDVVGAAKKAEEAVEKTSKVTKALGHVNDAMQTVSMATGVVSTIKQASSSNNQELSCAYFSTNFNAPKLDE